MEQILTVHDVSCKYGSEDGRTVKLKLVFNLYNYWLWYECPCSSYLSVWLVFVTILPNNNSDTWCCFRKSEQNDWFNYFHVASLVTLPICIPSWPFCKKNKCRHINFLVIQLKSGDELNYGKYSSNKCSVQRLIFTLI